MKKGLKRLAGIALAGALTIGTAAGFSACSSSSHMDKDGNITLSFWSIYPEGDANYQWTKDIISRFETENPTIKINYTGISFWDYFTKITTAMTDSSGPDIYLQTIKDTNDRASGGVSMDVTPYLDDEINKSCFYPQDLSTMEYEGGLYGLPYALDNRVLYYNIDIMNTLKTTADADWLATKAAKKAGTTISGKPSDLLDADGNVRAPETFDELMAYTELLTTQENGKITQLGFDVNVGNCMFVNFVWNLGGEFFEDGKPVVTTNEGVKKGFETWYEVAKVNSAAKLGNAAAQYNLGMAYACGYYGVTPDKDKALHWLKQSVKGENPSACLQVGLYYYYTVKTEAAYKKAFELFTDAYNLGEYEAIINIGLCYLQGNGVKEDKKEAVKCFKNAAEKCSSGVAYHNLGICYENGFGVRKDYKKAIEMYGKAVENGEKAGLEAIKNIYLKKGKDT